MIWGSGEEDLTAPKKRGGAGVWGCTNDSGCGGGLGREAARAQIAPEASSGPQVGTSCREPPVARRNPGYFNSVLISAHFGPAVGGHLDQRGELF